MLNAEFNKWEGITFSRARGQLYTSMTSITSGMLGATNYTTYTNGNPSATKVNAVNPQDVGGTQAVSVPQNQCGCVYYLNVDASYRFARPSFYLQRARPSSVLAICVICYSL